MKNKQPSFHTAAALAALAVAMLAGCGEKPQTGTSHANDSQAWNGARDAYVVPGWKPGDKASWEEQIRQRNRGQNDYLRIQ